MRLQNLRKYKGISQEQLAHMVNCSLNHYQNIEKGSVMPAVNLAIHICEILNIDPREVEEWKKRKEPPI